MTHPAIDLQIRVDYYIVIERDRGVQRLHIYLQCSRQDEHGGEYAGIMPFSISHNNVSLEVTW